MIDWRDSVYLTPYSWNNIAYDNNLFGEYIDVTNKGDNIDSIWVRIQDEDGNVICGPTWIQSGTTATLGRVPAFSGTYTIQAKSYSRSATFGLTIKTRSIG